MGQCRVSGGLQVLPGEETCGRLMGRLTGLRVHGGQSLPAPASAPHCKQELSDFPCSSGTVFPSQASFLIVNWRNKLISSR